MTRLIAYRPTTPCCYLTSRDGDAVNFVLSDGIIIHRTRQHFSLIAVHPRVNFPHTLDFPVRTPFPRILYNLYVLQQEQELPSTVERFYAQAFPLPHAVDSRLYIVCRPNTLAALLWSGCGHRAYSTFLVEIPTMLSTTEFFFNSIESTHLSARQNVSQLDLAMTQYSHY